MHDTSRFFRPSDVARLRRNQRRIQLARLLVIARNVGIVVAVAGGGVLLYRHTQNDARFAVTSIEIVGARHTPRASIDAITQRYVGKNLFQIDIAEVQEDLGTLAWISRIDIEKKLPDTLRINVLERTPIALVQQGQQLHYVDANGVAFAELSASVGDDDLPIIAEAAGQELMRSVALVRDLRTNDPQVFARVSHITPIAPDGFALYDRDLGAVVYARSGDLSAKWRSLYAIARSEELGESGIEYADLRFSDRVVIKPVRALARTTALTHGTAPGEITN